MVVFDVISHMYSKVSNISANLDSLIRFDALRKHHFPNITIYIYNVIKSLTIMYYAL